MKKLGLKEKDGFALAEALIAASICVVVLMGLMGIATLIVKLSRSNAERVQAAYIVEEGHEAVRVMRDNSWNTNINSLSRDEFYYLIFESGTWKSTTTEVFIDNQFERKFKINNVNRDANDDIVTSGGMLDPNVVKVTVSVAWSMGGATTTKSVETYLTNIFSN
jgi:Tfp pilus assembly protein PilV